MRPFVRGRESQVLKSRFRNLNGQDLSFFFFFFFVLNCRRQRTGFFFFFFFFFNFLLLFFFLNFALNYRRQRTGFFFFALNCCSFVCPTRQFHVLIRRRNRPEQSDKFCVFIRRQNRLEQSNRRMDSRSNGHISEEGHFFQRRGMGFIFSFF